MRIVGHENASHVIHLKNQQDKKKIISNRPNDELSLLSDIRTT